MVLSAKERAERSGRRAPPPAAAAAAPEPTAPPRLRRPKKEEGPYAVLEHPDSTEDDPVEGAFDVTIGGRPVRVRLTRGRVETRDPELAAYLLGLGYRKVNNDWPVDVDPRYAAERDRLRESYR